MAVVRSWRGITVLALQFGEDTVQWLVSYSMCLQYTIMTSWASCAMDFFDFARFAQCLDEH